MDPRACAPPKPEQTDRHEEAANHGGNQALLRLYVAGCIELLFLIEVEPAEKHRACDQRADQDPQERDAVDPQAEAVDAFEDERERLKPDVEQAVDERDVEV